VPPVGAAPSSGALDATSAHPQLRVSDVMAEEALVALIRVLQRRPDLVSALKDLLVPTAAAAASTPGFTTVAKYAAYRAVSERSISYDIKKMEEGKQFHRHGRTRRRVVIHVQEADAWYAQRAGERDVAASVEELAVDEVTRRRARVALKKRKES
jgi:hypothetical protein